MSKRILLLIIVFLLSCKNYRESNKLISFLSEYNVTLNTCKVIIIIPAEACSSCIKLSFEYIKGINSDYLLVLSSCYGKSINYLIENYCLDKTKLLIDKKNMASALWLIEPTGPTIYLVRNKRIYKKYEAEKILKNPEIFIEINTFLTDCK
ncbi:MAG TPA: hypothetical protein PK064_13100 [Bacteroidales bacterium]|nr:hypothetical protein [Bacteroidales bacterium]